MPTVTFIPKRCLDFECSDVNLISIGDPGEDYGETVRFANVLRLEFDDVEYDVGPEYTLFDYHLGLKLLRWVNNLPPGSDVVVHCHGGISRSPAVAKFLVERGGFTLALSQFSLNDWSRFNTLVFRTLEMVNLDLKLKP